MVALLLRLRLYISCFFLCLKDISICLVTLYSILRALLPSTMITFCVLWFFLYNYLLCGNLTFLYNYKPVIFNLAI